MFATIRRERLGVLPVDTRLAVRAGELLGATGAGSEMAVDAFLVAAGALDAREALVVTGDPGDIGRLAERAGQRHGRGHLTGGRHLAVSVGGAVSAYCG